MCRGFYHVSWHRMILQERPPDTLLELAPSKILFWFEP